MARPSKLTPETGETIRRYLLDGNTVEAAAEAAGISRRTFYDWMERAQAGGEGSKPYRDFAAEVERARAQAEAQLVETIADAKSWQAAAWLLERGWPEVWAKPADRARLAQEAAEPKADPFAEVDDLAARRAARAA